MWDRLKGPHASRSKIRGGGGKGKGGGVLARGEHHNDIGTRVNSGQVKTRMTVGFSRNDSIEGGYGDERRHNG